MKAKLGPSSASSARAPAPASMRATDKVKCFGKDKIAYGQIDIELAAVEQLVEISQTRAIAAAVQWLAKQPQQPSMRALMQHLEAAFDSGGERGGGAGLDVLAPAGFAKLGNLARPRAIEVAAAVNRLRGVRMVRR